MKREKDILLELQKGNEFHPNICRMAWVCQDKLTIALEPLWWPGSCSLRQRLMDHSVLTIQERHGIMEKVADALRFLHKREISHNDIHSSKIVLGQDLKQDVLLVDFSQACRFSKKPSPSIMASPQFEQAEAMNGQTVEIGDEVRIFSQWSFGVRHNFSQQHTTLYLAIFGVQYASIILRISPV